MVWIAGLCWGLSEKALAPHSSTLAWNIPWMEEPGRLQSMGLLRVGHDWATFLSLFTFMHWRRQWQPTPVFLPGESQGAWWAAVCGVARGRTRLKWLSMALYTWVYSSGSWWWTGRPGMLQSMRLQRIGHDWATELNWTELVSNKEILVSF